MTKTILANPKAVIGFAGAIVALAVATSYGAGAFVAPIESEPEEIAEVEVEPQAEATPSLATNQSDTTAWGDSGFADGGFADSGFADDSLSDDWNANTISAANNPSFSGSNAPSELGDEPVFNDLELEQGRSSSAGGNLREDEGKTYRLPSVLDGKTVQKGVDF